jgi:hypothetical protein
MVWSSDPPEKVNMDRLNSIIDEHERELHVDQRKRIDRHIRTNYKQLHDLAEERAEEYESQNAIRAEIFPARKVGEVSTQQIRPIKQLWQDMREDVDDNAFYQYIGAKSLRNGNIGILSKTKIGVLEIASKVFDTI